MSLTHLATKVLDFRLQLLDVVGGMVAFSNYAMAARLGQSNPRQSQWCFLHMKVGLAGGLCVSDPLFEYVFSFVHVESM